MTNRSVFTDEENKENMDDSRAETSMSNSTLNTTGGASHRVVNEKADVDANGYLDLSNLSLTNLSKSLRDDYLRVRKLNISYNEMQFFTYMELFKNCEILEARENRIRKFSNCVNKILQQLLLSNNLLKTANQFNRFENLKILDLSSNNISEDVVLCLKNLESLDLSKNELVTVPDVSKCPKLVVFNIEGNKITTLENISSFVPAENLETFDISSNLIDDLSQFSEMESFFNLRNIFVANNPCINELRAHPKFDYRVYLVACCSDQLRYIDDVEIDENLRTEGEWLMISGKIRKIKAGNHKTLCDFLANTFPEDQSFDSPTRAQLACQKILKKRKESISSQQATDSERTLNSVYSPFREWNGKIRESKNEMRKLNESLDRIDLSSTELPGTVVPRQINFEQFSNERKSTMVNRSAMMGINDTKLNTSYQEHYQRQIEESTTSSTSTLTRTVSSDSTHTIVISSARAETSISIDNDSQPTPTPVHETEILRNETPSEHRRIPSVADIIPNFDNDDENEQKQMKMEERLSKLEWMVNDLAQQKETLTTIVEQMGATLEDFVKDREETIQKMIPKPTNLTLKKLENSDSYVIRWDVPIVKEYDIWINGINHGRISGKHNAARIMDLDIEQEHSVQIQAISSNGISGEKSEPINIKPQ